MTQEELRDLLKERTQKEKQIYIANVTGVDKDVLSRFKLGKINLYPALFAKLENYLTIMAQLSRQKSEIFIMN